MALLSPGVEVTIIDQSQYLPAASSSVPFILMATAQDKANASGTGVAPGTLKVNANKLYQVTSQRDLVQLFGNPFFYKTTNGTPIQGYELNEYGELATYSLLGITNRAFVMRADIDLASLVGQVGRPKGSPPNGTYWLDTTNSSWGIFEFNLSTGTFTNQTPLVLVNASSVDAITGEPLSSVGNIGDYAVVQATTNVSLNFHYITGEVFSTYYYKNLDNIWVKVGSTEWKDSWPTIQGTTFSSPANAGVLNIIVTPTGLSDEQNGTLTTTISIPSRPVVEDVVALINAQEIPGIRAAVTAGKISIFSAQQASEANVIISGNQNYLSQLGLVGGSYNQPSVVWANNSNQPRWRTTDGAANAHPTGSVYFKTNAANSGTNLVVSSFNAATSAWIQAPAPLYLSDAQACNVYDPQGGLNIPVGALYTQYQGGDYPVQIFRRAVKGQTVVTGTIKNPTFTSGAFGSEVYGEQFLVSYTIPNSSNYSDPALATVRGTGGAAFAAAVSSAVGESSNLGNVTATINNVGQLVLTHGLGGSIVLSDAGVRGIDRVNVTNPGAYPNGTIVTATLSAPGLTNITATATSAISTVAPNAGQVTGIAVNVPGSGYQVPPNVVIDSPSGVGVQATARAVINDGQVTNIIITNPGSGYLTAPNVVVQDPPVLETATVAVTANPTDSIVAVVSTADNGLFTAVPTVTIDAPTITGNPTAEAVATLNTTANFSLAKINIIDGGSGYTSSTTVTITGSSLGDDAQAVAVISGGVIQSIDIGVNDHGLYAPGDVIQVIVSDVGGGIGASINAVNGYSLSYQVTSSGAGYDTATTGVTITPASSDTTGLASAVAYQGAVVNSIAVVNPGAGYIPGSTVEVTFAAHTSGGTPVTPIIEPAATASVSVGVIAKAGFAQNNTSIKYSEGYNRTYKSVPQGADSVTSGAGALFTVTASGENSSEFLYPTVTLEQAGSGYAVTDTIVFAQESVGSADGFPLVLRVNAVGVGGSITAYSVQGGYADLPSNVELTNWQSFGYIANEGAPAIDPANGQNWYYSVIDQVDIMINDADPGSPANWKGYRTVTNDVRGYDLTLTDVNGPIISATAPTTQSLGTPLVQGDLWIDTSDLENYPVINRWESVQDTLQWVLIDNTDQVSQNGVLFQDARWAPNGTTDPVNDPIPSIQSLLTSDYLDLDAPNADGYPQGMLLFNTRRSGYNIKQFRVDYFNATSFPDQVLPEETNAWVTVSGNMTNGAPYMGRLAQRAMVVAAMKQAIDTNTALREEDTFFNLIACPNYPELQPNMVLLNNDRTNTAYIVGDTPLRLPDTAQAITDWATNAAGATSTGEQGLVTRDTYMGLYYPSGMTTDLTGSNVVVPASHMMLRTILRNDTVAYPWFAPAGTRRGTIDNANNIGYLDATTGEFIAIKNRMGIRDVLYQNQINPLAYFTGVGLLNYGNKNSFDSQSALDRTNVARLIAYIRERLQVVAKPFVFEPNDALTRSEIRNVVLTLLADILAKRGIYDYLVVCDASNNTPARIDRNELWIDVAIEPVKAVEFIYIPVRILNTGEIAGLGQNG